MIFLFKAVYPFISGRDPSCGNHMLWGDLTVAILALKSTIPLGQPCTSVPWILWVIIDSSSPVILGKTGPLHRKSCEVSTIYPPVN